MAQAARKAKPSYLREVEGHRGHRAIVPDPAREIPDQFDNGLEPPKKLNRRQAQLWKQFVRRAPWLTQIDVMTAYIWVCLCVDFEENPSKFPTAKLQHLRSLINELGFDPSSRARLTKPADGGKPQPKFAGLFGKQNASNPADQSEDSDSAQG